MHRRVTITLVALAALLSCAGCIVTTSTYDAKVREVEALRDAYATSNRETSRLAGEVEALRDAHATSNRETSRLVGEVEALSKQVAGQKAALQEASSRADACEAGRTREKRESADRDRELTELRKKAGAKEEAAPRPATE